MVCVSDAPTPIAEKIARKNEKKRENAMKPGIAKGKEGNSKRMDGAVVGGRKAKLVTEQLFACGYTKLLETQKMVVLFRSVDRFHLCPRL
jgi:hypothetical protein